MSRSVSVCGLETFSLTGIMDSFCEEDYALSRYIAEFINSLTNLAYGMFPPDALDAIGR
jgi:hypothetical protein